MRAIGRALLNTGRNLLEIAFVCIEIDDVSEPPLTTTISDPAMLLFLRLAGRSFL